ncbi:MAG: hypothetical protein ABI919_11065, partial [Ramlibacter sp.]
MELPSRPLAGGLYRATSYESRFFNKAAADVLVQNTRNQRLIGHSLFEPFDLNVVESGQRGLPSWLDPALAVKVHQ